MGNLCLAYDILLGKAKYHLSLPMRSFYKGSRIGYIHAVWEFCKGHKISHSILSLRRNDRLPRILSRALCQALKYGQNSRMF